MIELRPASRKAIEYACTHFHYANRVPAVQYAYNIYNDDGEWCGVVIFGSGATGNMAKGVGFDVGEVCELERMALNGKQPCTSQVVAESLKRLHADAPQIKCVVSYADQNQGHFGTIYQATNWIYLGDTSKTSNAKPDAYIIRGKSYHPRSVGAKGWKQSIKWLRENIDPNAVEVWGMPKFKYVFVFDKRLRRKMMAKAKPYPKKGGDSNGERAESSTCEKQE